MKIHKVYTERVSPKRAEEILETNTYQGQRRLKPWLVNRYARLMQDGRWLDGSELKLAYIKGHSQNGHYLMNAQHRLSAQVQADHPVTYTVTVMQCEDEAEMAALYVSTDRGSKRTTADAWTATGKREEYGWNARQANSVAAAIKYINFGFARSGGTQMYLDDETILAEAEEYREAADHFFAVGQGAPKEIAFTLFRASVISLALVLYRYGDKEFVDEFWKGVIFDDGIAATDPRKHAHRHLMSTVTIKSRFRAKTVAAEYQTRLLGRCWNGWINDEKFTRAPFVKNEKMPIILSETRFEADATEPA